MSPSPPAPSGAVPAAARRAVRVGVLLPRLPEEPGAWFAECAAYDSAGADALWLDGGPDPAHDVLALAAALATATSRAKLVVALPDTVPQAALLARALATVVLLSAGRLALAADSRRCAELVAVAPKVPAFRRLAPAGPGYEEPGAGRWTPVAAPAGPDAWRAALAGAAERGVHGLVVPAGQPLLEALRRGPGAERHTRPSRPARARVTTERQTTRGSS
ncbi:hypothetical protein O7599_34185 [Streptomyces sp. WMMC500]|uniref:hypothetical protein n=1 Tax=Streptomyces sp. WMMC500 TaxID=3015154 RepID=UPI00248B0324|nr:hypothetical protein [Streptomyces sp. WMMC500]WBB60499.1 hypothetical protein O7599_34185 [Streptomyces sp. WMMC500]